MRRDNTLSITKIASADYRSFQIEYPYVMYGGHIAPHTTGTIGIVPPDKNNRRIIVTGFCVSPTSHTLVTVKMRFYKWIGYPYISGSFVKQRYGTVSHVFESPFTSEYGDELIVDIVNNSDNTLTFNIVIYMYLEKKA